VRVLGTGTQPSDWQDTIWLMMDQLDIGVSNAPDYAFGWDTKGRFEPGQQQEHGLELMVLNSYGATWGNVTMGDRDGLWSAKISPPDFNTNGNGFVRTIDAQLTLGFTNTTFVDMAIAWNYLSAPATTCTLARGQAWRVQYASRADSTTTPRPMTTSPAMARPPARSRCGATPSWCPNRHLEPGRTGGVAAAGLAAPAPRALTRRAVRCPRDSKFVFNGAWRAYFLQSRRSPSYDPDFRRRGPSNSHRKMPCHVPRHRRPPLTSTRDG
jgi:hypothetical protein